MSNKKNIALFCAVVSFFTAFSQDKLEKEVDVTNYSYTNIIPYNPSSEAHPSQLSEFLSFYKNHKIVLAWKTIAEKNLSGFKLERSEDGKNFEKVAFEKAKGIYSIDAYYEVSDAKAKPEISYVYRLSQIASDGTEELVKTTENNAKCKDCKMSLNTVIENEKLVVSTDCKNMNEVILRILDKDGKVVLIEHPQAAKSEINIDWFVKGLYTLKLCTSDCELQKKFIKN